MKTKIEEYVRKIEANCNEHFAKDAERHGHKAHVYTFGIDFGSKYARVWRTDSSGSRSSFGFVDMTNGNVLKSASWKAPAKGPRGHIDQEPNKGWIYSIT